MNASLFAPALALASFVGILVMLEWGRRIGKRQQAVEGGAAREGVTAVEGSVYALGGLLIAFTFSGAAQRFEDRRHLVVQEANDIGTAWLRIDLLPAATQEPMRALFRQYLDARLAIYRAAGDPDASSAGIARANALQNRIWSDAVAACRSADVVAACMLLLPALNAMFDTASARTAATMMHPPWVIYGMLWLFVLVGALLAGHAMAGASKRDLLHTVVYAAIMGAILYVIADIEFPRLGLIRVDAIDALLEGVRRSMG